jgi:hypothetical protein
MKTAPSIINARYAGPHVASVGGDEYVPHRQTNMSRTGIGVRRGSPRGLTRGELRQPLGRQVLRLGVDGVGRRAGKGDALVMVKHGLAVDRRHFPVVKHAESCTDATSPSRRRSRQ